MIWLNEQVDPSGIVYSCIAYSNEDLARDCYESWIQDLTEEQINNGWQVRLRLIESWDDVPVNALKLG